MTTPQQDPADYWTGPSVWLFDPVGYPAGAVAFVGITLFPAGLDPKTTQTAVCVFGPGGGRVNVPAVFDGAPGPSPQLRNLNLQQVPFGQALPNPPGAFREVIPGGPGVPSVYDVDIALNSGAPGETGVFEMQNATDLVGSLVDGDVPVWDAETSKFDSQQFPFAAVRNVTGIAPTGTTAGQTRSLSNITMGPYPYSWLPVVVGGDVEVTGTVATQVDAVVRMGGAANTQNGAEIARGFGTLGTAGLTAPSISSTFAGGLVESGFGLVAAGDTAQFFFNTENQQSTTDTYATGRAGFTVAALMVSK